jgi:hypothetical protein
MERNPYWIPIIRELRAYLKDSSGAESFQFTSFLLKNCPFEAAIAYVKQLSV